jgi:hypothetical protein
MPTTRTYNRSFAGGEVSPEMWGRLDDVKFQTGAATMRNFIATPQGPAENRAGTQFVREVKDSTKRTRLIPFTYSTTQTMVIEIGAGYLRFHTQGATLGPGTPAAYNGATAYTVGSLVSSGGVNYYCIAATTGNAPPNATYWYEQPSGIYEIPSPYGESDLFDIHYVQSADVLTLVHPSYAPRELRRLGAASWTLTSITFGATISTPGAPTVTPTVGQGINITAITQANPGHITVANDAKNKTLGEGDEIYISGVAGMTQINNKYYIIDTFHAVDRFSVTEYQTGVKVNTTTYGAYTSGGTVQKTIQLQDQENFYVITAIAANGIDETTASSAGSATNNLTVTGAFNTVSWSAVSGASRYNIYKRQSGLYGYIGQTESTSFVDDNIAPDMGITPPVVETLFSSTGNYPGAVSYFEQRRVFAGTNNAPQTMWMTRTSTESDMSYHIPVQDTDRINFRVAAREANTIRHIVPLTQLLALTSAAEWRISPVNSDVITPTTISVRPQSYVGASNVQPSIVNNTVVYGSDRDGHVRELGYSWQASGFVTGDLSLRSTHLFDGLSITDMCYSKAPHPLLWFISSNGDLLGLTYIPEQQVAAWHRHDTDGDFESCTAVAEGTEDSLYVVVKRTIGGSTKRYVERFATRAVSSLENCFHVDSGLTYNGTNTTSTTVTVTGGTAWTPAEVLTITASAAIFQFPATTDVGDVIVLTGSDGTKYRLTILSTTSPTVATARVDNTLAVALRGVATATWAWARDTVSGLAHLNGKTVSVLGDGAVMPQVVVSGGSVTIQRPATIITVGLPYESDLETLPLTLQIEAFGQGRAKNINTAFVRVYRSSGLFIGPNEDRLVEAKWRTTEPYGSPPDLKTDEVTVVLTPSWQQSGQIFIRQTDPLPLTIVGLTLEVAIGG